MKAFFFLMLAYAFLFLLLVFMTPLIYYFFYSAKKIKYEIEEDRKRWVHRRLRSRRKKARHASQRRASGPCLTGNNKIHGKETHTS